MQSDAKARDYVKTGQRLSASDVIFAEAAPVLEKAVAGIDTARGQERVAHAVALEGLRRWELIALGSAAAVVLVVLVLLVPIPPAGEAAAEAGAAGEAAGIPQQDGGLRVSRDFDDGIVSRAQAVAADDAPSPFAGRAAGAPGLALADGTSKDNSLGLIDFALDGPGPAKGPDLDAVADLCSSLARVQDTRELQGLLERAAKALDATGIIIWMPDGAQGTLRPVLAHGYASLALARMGIIHPAADNATATAYPHEERRRGAGRGAGKRGGRGAAHQLGWMFGRDGGRAARGRRGHAAASRRGHHRGRPARDDAHARVRSRRRARRPTSRAGRTRCSTRRSWRDCAGPRMPSATPRSSASWSSCSG